MPPELAPDQLLRWYIDAGADETIGEVAMDRFQAQPPPRPVPVAVAAAPSPDRPAPPRPAAGPAVIVPTGGTAAHIAAECHDLEQLRLAMEAFDGLPLKKTALSTVFADGNPEAKVMCIGEAPGQEEDRQGRPFVGRSGKLLDRMLASIGLDRSSAYITNVLPWRPLDNRKPTPDEVAVCLPFVTRHIELVDPQVLILFGGASASALLARHEGIMRLRGHWHDFSSPGLPRPLPAMATFHPAYLLRTPAAKREAWRDLLAVWKRLNQVT
ncbi:uracil-DNA glycosylase [Magnetospirillum moscoviense]|uniref:Type-4 uracil-DNA glycosylase n=1 Tax=Magnetospirillum moscoviense TaxID=1437059 RepID=A0A178MLH3_9PROT|nr:uracil-DNA glycosylase [Magnetospirillum moscoviense]OAN49526.1 uracil-DNA glycosylase [Magnetospirillum moscoviense]